MMEKGKKKRQIQMSKIRTKKGNKRTYKVGVFHVDKRKRDGKEGKAKLRR